MKKILLFLLLILSGSILEQNLQARYSREYRTNYSNCCDSCDCNRPGTGVGMLLFF